MSQPNFEAGNTIETGSPRPQLEQIDQHIAQQIDQTAKLLQTQDPQRAKFLTDLKPVLGKMIDSYCSNPSALFKKKADQPSIFETVLNAQPTK